MNPASQIASHTRSNDTYAWTDHYAVTRAYTTDGLNRHTAAGPATFTYDANGNLTGDGTRTYTYNAANQLYQGGAAGSWLYYDPLGRLSNVIPSDWSSYRISLYDGDRVIAEDAGWGTILRRFVFGPGLDEPLVWYEGAGTSDRRWLHADERGSIVAASNDSGAVTAVNRYDEYGVPQGGTLTGRFGYTGQQWIPELGMYYYRARIYSPTLGRFMQTDPIGYGGGMNLYAYVGNDPVNATDPSGLTPGFKPPPEKCTGDFCSSGPPATGSRIPGGGGSGSLSFVLGMSAEVRDRSDFFQGGAFIGSKYSPWVPIAFSSFSSAGGCSVHRARMMRTWAAANVGPESEENERSVWFRRRGNDFTAAPGGDIVGRGSITDSMMRYQPDGYDILFHTHNSRLLSPWLSRLDATLLSRNPITMVIYAGERNWQVYESPLLTRRGR